MYVCYMLGVLFFVLFYGSGMFPSFFHHVLVSLSDVSTVLVIP